MQPFKFETTISKGRSLCFQPIWRNSWMGLLLLLLLAFNSCQLETSTERIHFEETETSVRAITPDYTLELGEEAMIMHLPSGGESSLSFMNPMKKVSKEESEDLTLINEMEDIAITLYSKDEKLAAYDVILAPGADQDDIQMQLAPGQIAEIETNGDLLIPTPEGIIKHSKPVAFQYIDGEKIAVASSFKLEGQVVGFELGDYDSNYELVIDPEVSFMPVAQSLAGSMMACTYTLEVFVGECTNDETTGNVSKTIISVRPILDDPSMGPASNEMLTISIPALGLAVSEDIDLTAIDCSGYVQFIVDLTNTGGNQVTVNASSSGSCTAASVMVDLPEACDPPPCGAAGEVGGFIFKDYNHNGVQDASETGTGGVSVVVFDENNNQVATTSADSRGYWRATTGLSNGDEIRVEFFDIQNGFFSGVGTNNVGVSVQFVQVGDCDVDFGVAQIVDFCQETPDVIVPCYVKGDPLAPGSESADQEALIVVPYDADGTDPSDKQSIATAAEIGSAWGVAFNRNTRNVFVASMLKRHSGWGPEGLGGIYKVDASGLPSTPNSGNTSTYINLDNFTIDAGDEALLDRADQTNSPENFLPPHSTTTASPNWDAAAFDLVGKVGLGDIDISDDADSIFVVNLNTKSVVIIQNNPATDVPTSATEVTIPDPGCADADDWRPWALKYSRGKVYVGGVCSAQSSGLDEDMTATVYEYDPQNGTWTVLVSFPLGYPKGSPVTFLANPPATCSKWNPWISDWNDLEFDGQQVCLPQPILSDIEIDIFGNFTLAFIDRSGHQVGYYNYSTIHPNTQVYQGNVGGDVIRAYNNNGTLLIEKNATAGFSTSAGENNNEGPCEGEFYFQDSFGGGHSETAHGGLAIHPSNNEILLDVMDPLNAFSAGLAWYNNNTGGAQRRYEIYRDASQLAVSFGKAAGLGDIEILCDPGNLRISNLVFIDDNANGIQDVGDVLLDGVKVTLYEVTGPSTLVEISTKTTGSGFPTGQYEFTTADGLKPNTRYIIAFGTMGQFSDGLLDLGGGDFYVPTQANVNSGSRFDERDSDAEEADNTFAVVEGLPVIDYTTGNLNENDPTLDAGFVEGGFDYGDLPDSYSTEEPNAPKHLASETLKLGACVDVELDGQEEAMAGAMTGGDDNNTGITTFGTCASTGDDEDGITFLTPMIPGEQACISVTAMNGTESNAILQAWIDWNGDGQFQNATEAVTLEHATFADNTIPSPMNGPQTFCFDVPSNATFREGNAFIRFRLSPSGGLAPDSEGDNAPIGEIEDYKVGLAKVGNLVFEDRNFDGVQDATGEPGINGVNVDLIFAGTNGVIGTGNDDITYSLTTGADGEYYFCGLIPGNYKVVFNTPNNMTPTRSNIGNQTDGGDADSDGTITGMDLSMAMESFMIPADVTTLPTGENGNGDDATNPTGSFPDNQTDETHDQGFAVLDYGDLPEDGNGDDFKTRMVENGAVHVVIPELRLGSSADGETDGVPTGTANGDDGDGNDDEDGISFGTPLVPGNQACIQVTAVNSTGSMAFLQGWIDWDNNGLLDNDENLVFTNGGMIPATIVNLDYCFNVPADAIFNDGMVMARFRISPSNTLGPNGPDKFDANTTVPVGEVEDYKLNLGKIGNLVFEDYDFDGKQDGGEPGINGVDVSLVWAGPNGIIGTGGDDVTYSSIITGAGSLENGEFYYCGLIPGTYKLIYTTPTDLTPTRPNVPGGNVDDSDGVITGMDLSMVMETFTIGNVLQLPTSENALGDNGTTPTGTFPDGQVDETHDQGFARLDYGDLPEDGNGDDFSSTMGETGAVHVIIPGLRLGASVAPERDATPNAGATGDGSEEDGIIFGTPLIPGNQACVQVSATGTNAVLQGWIDWDNSGTLDNDEALAFTNAGAVNGTLNNADFCFPVPTDAIFNDGMVFARFRLSPSGGLGPNGPDKYSLEGTVPQGEVEDHKINVGKIGNIVFEDRDFDGVQDASGEPGINGVDVSLIWAGPNGVIGTGNDDITYNSIITGSGTLNNGEYYYCGLIPGTYKLVYTTPTDMTPTRTNVPGSDQLDSDGAITGMDLTMAMETFSIGNVTQLPVSENGLGDDATSPTGTFPDNQVDETHDQGFAFLDYGDLPEDDTPTSNDDFSTVMISNGAVHVRIPELGLGSQVDGDRDGIPSVLANGDDIEGDDEDGIQFDAPLIPDNESCIKVTAYNTTGSNAILQAWIDWDNSGTLESDEELDFTNNGVISGNITGANFCFPVPADARFNDGMVMSRFRISPRGGLGPNGPAKFDNNAVVPQGEVEDHKINVGKIGNYVWEDYNYDGLQSTGEPAIEEVEVMLTWFGEDGTPDGSGNNADITYKTIKTDANGEYYFCGLINGTYKLTVITPDDMTPGRNDGGIEDRDSDGNIMGNDLSQVMTDPIVIADVTALNTTENGTNDDSPNPTGTFPNNQVDERYDFAFNGIDYGDLPNTYTTLSGSNGPRHILQANKFLGGCSDAEREAYEDPLAGLRETSNGDDNNMSEYVQGNCTEAGDDEDGIEFPTPLVPGYEACVTVDYTAIDITGFDRANTALSAWIDFDGDGAFQSDERILFTKKGGSSIAPTVNVSLAEGSFTDLELCFKVPADATFNGGKIAARFRLNCETDPNAVTPGGDLVGGEVEDYWLPVAKVGQYTWFDNDLRGDQEFTDAPNTGEHIDEVGINDVDFVLLWAGEDGIFNNADDRKYLKTSATGTQGETEDGTGGTADGIYYFCGLQEGKFKVLPLKYANPTNTGMNQVVGEDGTVYDISDPDNIIIDGGDPTPRYSIVPNRKILTRPDNTSDEDEDSDGAPMYEFMIPDLVADGLVVNENGNGDLPTIYNYPDTLTEMRLDFGWVQEPNIEVLQRIVGVDFPQSGTCDHFNVIVDVCLVNTGGYEMGYDMGVPLKNLQLMGDLSSQLGATFIDVVSTQLIGSGTDNNGVSADITTLEYGPTPTAPQQYPTLNPNYDGAGNKNLFAANTGFIWPGEKVMLRYVFEVNPENVPMMQGIDLQWNLMGSGKATNYQMQEIPDFFQAGGPQYMAMDVSSDYTGETGIQIDGTYDDPDDPTNLGDCWKKASQFAAHQQVNFTTNSDCDVVLDESNLITPYYGECDEGVYPLGGYYRFRIEGQPGLFFEPTAVAGEAIVNGKIKFMVQTVNKICEPRWGELLIEDKSEPVIMPPSDKYLECWLLDDVLNNPGTVAPAGDGDGENSDPATFDGGDGDDDNDLGFPKVTDGCEGHLIPFKWSDAVVYYDCDSPYDTKDYRVTAVLTRRFSAADAQGNQTTATQTIYFVGPRTSIDGDNNVTSADYWGWGPLVDPSDRDGDGVKFYYDVEAGLWVYTLQSCDAPSEQVGELYPYYTGQLDCETGQFNQLVDIDPAPDNVVLGPDYRDAFGNKVRLDEVNCNLSVQTDNRQFSDVCSDGSYKQERHLRIFDWCEGSSDGTAFPYLVKVGDFAPPVLDNCVLNPLDVPGVRRRTNFGDAETVIELLNGDTDGDGDLENDQIRPEHIEAGQITFFDDEDEELKEEGYTVSVCLEMVSTGPMDCTASLNTDLGALRALWGRQLVRDCEDPTVTSEIYSFSEVYVGGFPTGEYAWQIGGYSMVGTMAVGIPVGLHALVFSATDNCYNSNLGIIFFTVMDGTKPVMKCDDELRVTLVDGDPKLQIQGYALATAADVDEGSWDNCGPVDLHVRRIINDADVQADWEAKNGRALINEYDDNDPDYNQGYTGWDDLVEFFCGDLDEKVTVELRGSDTKKIWRKCIENCGGSTSDDVYIYSIFRKTQEQQDDGWEHVKTPNQSVCWLEVEVENGTNYTVELDGGGTALCTDDFNADDFITVTYLGLQCASPDIEVVVEPELDQCGIGRYKIYLQDNTDVESKNRPNVDPNPVYVYVRPYHDYWIKFPKDAIYDCGADQEVGGVETSADLEIGCDLLAISTLPDERFAATSDPDACYKIFRTYRVINWCEYDGQQEPVVVSRDWDSWNGFDFGTSTTSDDRDPNARREYNINPQFPDGDDNPGNTDLYVIVKRNLNDDLVDRVFYDADSDPTANVGEVSTDQPRFGSNGSGNTDVETYWWQVTSGSRGIVDLAPAGNSSNDYFGDTEANEPDWDLDTNNESYYDGSYRGQPVRWGYDPNVSNADPNGSANDSSDNDDDDQYYGSVGFWQYTQHIIVYDDTAPEVRVEAEQECSINGETCDAETSFDIVITDVCSLDDITLKVYVNGEAASDVALNATDTAVIATVTGRRGLGNYKISGEVNDGCGNITPFDGELEVVDCKAPAPICQNGMVVELMPQEGGGGAMAVWASDFIGSRVGDCTGQELDNLVPVAADGSVLLPAIAKEAYSIYFEDSVGVDFEYTSPYDSAALRGITLTCDHLAGAARNAVMIRVYAEDASGNHDFCRTFVDLQDNMGACSVAGATGDIAGLVATEDIVPVEGVELQLSGAQSMMYMTTFEGDYAFRSLNQGHDFSVIPHKDDNHSNGVSTFDLILIQKHILGSDLLESPYQLIAADANNSKSVSTLDLIQIRKLILNIDTEFTNNTSWRFVDADYVFPSKANPWRESFPEIKNINNLESDELANFIAVKIGDVNGSAIANSVQATKGRSVVDVLEIETAEQKMKQGQIYEIVFRADMSEVAGYQFTLELDPTQVSLLDVGEGLAGLENFGVFAETGVVTTSYHVSGGAAISGSGELFTIQVQALANVNLSEVIGISSRYTVAEAYDQSDRDLAVALLVGKNVSGSEFALYQNNPNPFQAETVISFLLPEAMEGVLEFKDVQGRTILLKEGDFTNGYNELRLRANELPAAGVYFYTLHAGDYTATKKLILLKR